MAAMLRHQIPTSKAPLPSLLWLPQRATGRVPGIVVFQEIYGLSDYVRARCADLAELGYAVLAPQLFARLDPPVSAVQEDGVDPQAALAQALELSGQLDWDQAVRDGLSAMNDLSRIGPVKKKKVAVLGFCLGGGLAFNVAAAATAAGRPPAALVSYYGSALPHLLDLAPQVTCPSLHVFGTDDDYIPMERVETIREAVTDGGDREQVRFELHEGAGHAFDNPNPLFHHEEASKAAWAQTQDFLAEVLPVADPGA